MPQAPFWGIKRKAVTRQTVKPCAGLASCDESCDETNHQSSQPWSAAAQQHPLHSSTLARPPRKRRATWRRKARKPPTLVNTLIKETIVINVMVSWSVTLCHSSSEVIYYQCHLLINDERRWRLSSIMTRWNQHSWPSQDEIAFILCKASAHSPMRATRARLSSVSLHPPRARPVASIFSSSADRVPATAAATPPPPPPPPS
mmetsp:Transcript_40497/g.79342  ORF Transcript_40497/g.79342 Transcript_40497/m.79342 type:complete len:202 (-) Transcript_40497:16-621(-)